MLAVENRHTYAYTARPLPIANWEKDMETFEYNSDLTYQENFERWSRMNRDEKSDYNETPYTKEQGAAVFFSIFKNIEPIEPRDCPHFDMG